MTEPQQPIPIVILDTPDARRLGDLALIKHDLSVTIDCCSRLLQLEAQGIDDWILRQALWTSALVHYVRCFSTGKRSSLSETDLVGLPGEPVETHRYYKSIRDKHIAHSVNALEQVQVGLGLSPPDQQPRRVEGVAILLGQQIAPNQDNVRMLATIASSARSIVTVRGKTLEEKILTDSASLDINVLATSATPRVTVPGLEGVLRPRS